ncbi:MAG: CarD-like/TRCF domain protein [Lachnospiraceae bacterium]|nr:CarD-like/TRCF domain protein [Lachnospiraceae bacterium]
MFQKKEIIYSETLGVCTVDDIVKLADSRKDTYYYYLLRSVFDKNKKAYIPVENHSVQLRNLITRQEAFRLHEDEKFNEQSAQIKGEVQYVIEKAESENAK